MTESTQPEAMPLSAPPPLPPALADLLTDATDEATRLGHARVTPWHLVRVLGRDHPDLAARVLGPEMLTDAAMHLSTEQRIFAPPVPTPGTWQALASAAGASDPLGALAATLHSVTGAAPKSPGSGTGSVVQLSAVRQRYAEVVITDPTLLPRAQTIDAIVASLGAGGTPLVVAPEGAGRTSLANLLVERLPAVGGRAGADRVVRVRAGDVVARDTAAQIDALLADVEGRAVVVLDDLEVLSGMGGQSRIDAATLAVIRGAVENPLRRVVLLLGAPYLGTLRSQEPELVAECTLIEIDVMSEADVRYIATRHARAAARAHGVDMGEDCVIAAVSSPRAADVDVHPALAVRRLDRAAAVASLRADRTVTPSDVVPPIVHPVFDPTAFRATLASKIVGQDEAIEAVTKRLSVTRAELDLRPNRPDAVMLLAGPTGTGKTALAQAVSIALFGTEDALIRLDMSEYSEPHTVAKLVGSPPGYVGSTDPSSWLTTHILAHPDCVLLLDEIEKADPVVWNTFLQVFDAGRLSDGLGRTADFRRVAVMLTTNIGARVFEGRDAAVANDPAADSASVLSAVKERMAPELVNRLDDVLVFRPLSMTAIELITRRLLDDVVRSSAARGYVLSYDDAVVTTVAANGYDPAYGARPVQRSIEAMVLQPLAALPPGTYHATTTPPTITWSPPISTASVDQRS